MKSQQKSRTRESGKKVEKSYVHKCFRGDLELLYTGIRVAENAAEEGNTDLGEVIAKKPS